MEVTVLWGALWHCTEIYLHLSSHIISNNCLEEVRTPALGYLTEYRCAACTFCRRGHLAIYLCMVAQGFFCWSESVSFKHLGIALFVKNFFIPNTIFGKAEKILLSFMCFSSDLYIVFQITSSPKIKVSQHFSLVSFSSLAPKIFQFIYHSFPLDVPEQSYEQ